MKFIISFFILLFYLNSFGQINSADAKTVNCEALTMQTINQISKVFNINNLESYQSDFFDPTTKFWIKHCGISESTQRLIIIHKILAHENSIDAIKTYFDNDFQYTYNSRLEASKRIDYGYIYSESKAYFGYVPLRHPIDSIIVNISQRLLQTNTLTTDEQLICLLFSGEKEEFEKAVRKQNKNESTIKHDLLKRYRNNSNNQLAYSIYTGVFKPISPDETFTYSPLFGITIGSPFKNKLIVEMGVKFRLALNAKPFQYYALGNTHTIEPDVRIFMGGLIGYKIYEQKNLTLLPKFGIGLETVEFNLPNSVNNPDKEIFNVKTLHLSIGLSAMTPIFRKSHLGLSISYHYCPYQLDKNLLTSFQNNLISTELFWRL